MAAMIVFVSVTASSPARRTASPTRTVTGCDPIMLGTLDERGQTASVPERPTGTTGAPVEAARRAAPVLPWRTGSKKASPRGMVPSGRITTTSPARSAASASTMGDCEPLPRSTGMPPSERATQPSTGTSKISCLPRKRTGRPRRAAMIARGATSK